MSQNLKPEVVAIIPARYASTRLPAKPLIDLCGKPMIQHVYEGAKQAALVDRVIVATDHQAIVDATRGFGGDAVMTPVSCRSGSDRIAHVAKWLGTTDIIVNVQGDEPMITPEMIDDAVRLVTEDSEVQVGTLIRKICSGEELTSFNVVKVVLDRNGFAIYFSRSPIPSLRDRVDMSTWHFEHTFYKHIGLYAYRKEFLLEFASWPQSILESAEKLEQLRIIEHGYKIKTAETVHDSIPVDTAADAECIRRIMKQHISIGTA